MKFTCVFILASVLSLSAEVYSQSKLVNLKLKNVSLVKVFEEIEKNAGYTFLYKADLLKDKQNINVEASNKPLQKVLNDILSPLGLKHKFNDDLIIISPTKIDNTIQQTEKIKGKITDTKGNPLPGVTILVKGSKVGIASDINGKFEINAQKGDILVLSFVGMKTKEVKIAEKKDLNIKLENDSENLDEVVITGYSTIEKRKMSSAITTVKGEEIKESGIESVDKMLQGKIAGVTVIGQSSTPGAAPKIRIRGASSISGNREPVWVVDGVILEDPVKISTEELNSLDNVNYVGNAISFLNPEDIDKISILKDASATAIYGVKAANGVIVVTTKKGVKGKAKVRYSNSFAVTMAPTYDDMYRMNSKDRIEVSEEMEARSLTYEEYFKPGNVAYEGAVTDLWNKDISYNEYLDRVKGLKEQNTDWYDLLFRNALSQSHNLTISGADDNTNYYFSVGYAQNQGATEDVDYKKLNALLKVNTKLRDNLRVGIQINAGTTKNTRPHSSLDLNQYAYNTSRAVKAYNPDGSQFFYNKEKGFDNVPLTYNIFNELEESNRVIDNKSLRFQFTLDWDIAKGVKYHGLVAYTINNSNDKEWATEKSFYASSLRGTQYGQPLPTDNNDFAEDKCYLPYGGELSNSNTKNTAYIVRNSLAFTKSLDVHLFSANVGTELSSNKYDGLQSLQRGYLHDKGMKIASVNLVNWPAYAQWVSENGDIITNTITNQVSLYGTFNYSYKNKYSANINVRADGSNKFGQDKDARFLPVWSISGRWNIHEEEIFSNMLWMNSLALRGSYGVQGNVHPDQVPTLIAQMGTLDETKGEFTSTLYKLPNDKLKWEKTKSYNLGFEFALFNNILYGTVDYYNKKGVDQIISKRVSATTGASTVSINAGDVLNKGIELSLNIVPIKTKDITWSLSINGAKNTNEVTEAGSSNYTYEDYLSGSIVKKGDAINSFYSYKFNGLDENGLPTFKDIEEIDGISKEEMFEKVFVYSGKRVPDVTGGFSTSLRYKNFTINGLFTYSLGSDMRLNDLYKNTGQALPHPEQNMSTEFLDRWKQAGDQDKTNIPALSNDRLKMDRDIEIADNMWEMYNKSDLRVVSGDFLRLKNVGIRYNFEKHICKKINCENITLRFDASNLFVIADEKLKGRDPEQISFGAGALPPQKTFNLGLSVTF